MARFNPNSFINFINLKSWVSWTDVPLEKHQIEAQDPYLWKEGGSSKDKKRAGLRVRVLEKWPHEANQLEVHPSGGKDLPWWGSGGRGSKKDMNR